MTEVQTRLNATEQSVRTATKSLAEKRQQLVRAQSAMGELETIKQKVSNLKRSISSLDAAEFTGRTVLVRESRGQTSVPAAFQPLDVFVQPGAPTADLRIPEVGEMGGLEKLRKMNMWEDRIEQVLRDRLVESMSKSKGNSTEKAVQYRRLIASILRIPAAEVESVSLSSFLHSTSS